MSSTKKFQGSGLGLTVCSDLVKQMGSSLMVESELGRGSKFHFTITVPTADENQISPVISNVDEPNEKPHTIVNATTTSLTPATDLTSTTPLTSTQLLPSTFLTPRSLQTRSIVAKTSNIGNTTAGSNILILNQVDSPFCQNPASTNEHQFNSINAPIVATIKQNDESGLTERRSESSSHHTSDQSCLEDSKSQPINISTSGSRSMMSPVNEDETSSSQFDDSSSASSMDTPTCMSRATTDISTMIPSSSIGSNITPLRILCAEDNKINQKVMRKLISRAG